MKALLLFLIIPIFLLWAHTTEQQTCDRKFVVGLNNYAPFAFREDGKLQGLSHDLVTDLARTTRCQFIEQEVTRPSTVDELKRGHLDVVMLVVAGSEYNPYGNFHSLYKSTRELTVLKKFYHPNNKISNYLNDPKVKFGQLIGTATVLSNSSEQKKLLRQGRIVGVPDPEAAFRLLKQGRVQALLFSSFLTDYYVKKMKMEDKVMRIREYSAPIDVGVYYSKRRLNDDEEKLLHDAFEKLKKDGSLYKILVKYMGEQEANRRMPNK